MFECPRDLPKDFFREHFEWRKNAKASVLPECKAEWSHWLRGGSASGIQLEAIAGKHFEKEKQ
jgi:hypothetical protein